MDLVSLSRSTGLLLLAQLAAHGSAPRSQPPALSEPIQILVLGTFHMGASRDPLNPTVDDLLEERRQAELDELVERLAAFEPTKVALEATGSALSGDYELYLAGRLVPRPDERHQVGFRLARRAGHSRVFGFDHELWLEPQRILTWAYENGQQAVATVAMAQYGDVASTFGGSFMRESSIVDIYRAFNSVVTDQALHDVFQSMILIGNEVEPIGPTHLAQWYERNIRIAGNVIRVAEPGDRIVVPFGANHRKLLVEFLDRTSGFEVVDTLEFLGG